MIKLITHDQMKNYPTARTKYLSNLGWPTDAERLVHNSCCEKYLNYTLLRVLSTCGLFQLHLPHYSFVVKFVFVCLLREVSILPVAIH